MPAGRADNRQACGPVRLLIEVISQAARVCDRLFTKSAVAGSA